jgi:tetratricopeptide (TPR) repeat protein
LIEYAAASFHFEEAGHERYHACVENNLGFLFSTLKRYEEAHEHLDRAQMLMTRLKDNVHLAQVDETRARVLLAEGRTVEAEKTARSAVLKLEKGDELSLLAEALTTHGIALARLEHSEQAGAALDRAISVAEHAGDFQSAGIAALSKIELLGTHLSYEGVFATIDRVGVLLETTRDITILRRLGKAFQALFLAHVSPATPDWTDFSLRQTVLRYESHLIKLALLHSEGSVTRAARLLGFNHHQSLISLIASRHSELLTVRSPVHKRRQHLMSHPKRKKKQEN